MRGSTALVRIRPQPPHCSSSHTTRDLPAHQLGRGLSSPSGDTAMRCTSPPCTSSLCTSLPCTAPAGPVARVAQVCTAASSPALRRIRVPQPLACSCAAKSRACSSTPAPLTRGSAPRTRSAPVSRRLQPRAPHLRPAPPARPARHLLTRATWVRSCARSRAYRARAEPHATSARARSCPPLAPAPAPPCTSACCGRQLPRPPVCYRRSRTCAARRPHTPPAGLLAASGLGPPGSTPACSKQRKGGREDLPGRGTAGGKKKGTQERQNRERRKGNRTSQGLMRNFRKLQGPIYKA
jgi:hypothetical protein